MVGLALLAAGCGKSSSSSDLDHLTVAVDVPVTGSPYVAQTIRQGVEGAWAWVEVADTGIGMSSEVQARIFDNGQVRRFVNIYVNDEDVRFLDNLQTATKDGDVLAIIPAVAGG